MARRARVVSGKRDMYGGMYANVPRDHRLTPISDSVPMMHRSFSVMLGARPGATSNLSMSAASMHQRMLRMTGGDAYC